MLYDSFIILQNDCQFIQVSLMGIFFFRSLFYGTLQHRKIFVQILYWFSETLHNLEWPEAHYVASQSACNSIHGDLPTLRPNARIKGMRHYTQQNVCAFLTERFRYCPFAQSIIFNFQQCIFCKMVCIPLVNQINSKIFFVFITFLSVRKIPIHAPPLLFLNVHPYLKKYISCTPFSWINRLTTYYDSYAEILLSNLNYNS